MRLAVVGVGSAGSRIVNRILEVEESTGRNLSRGNALVIDTGLTDFEADEYVTEDRRLVIGDVHREVNGEGAGGDPDLGAEIAREERHDIVRAFDAIEFTAVDGVLLVAGLGGGTGSGAGAVVLEALQAICEIPVYALGVLPSVEEGGDRALNAARALRSFVEIADNVIVFDNDTWGSEEGQYDEDYRDMNHALATRIVTLFAAGEFDEPTVGENRMDPSDIMRTLDTGGLSTIGYAASDLSEPSGLFAWLRNISWPWQSGEDEEEPPTNAARINQLVRRAAHSNLTLPCEISSAERALILLSGPPRELSRKGFESGRYWLEEEADTVEVMAGDEPHERTSELTAVVLLSNVTDVPRVESMQAHALAARDDASGEPEAVLEPGTTD